MNPLKMKTLISRDQNLGEIPIKLNWLFYRI